MNSILVAEGMMNGGTEEARACLGRFWRAVSDAAQGSPLRRTPIDVFMGNWKLDSSPVYLLPDLLGRVASHSEPNPLNFNPLRDLTASIIYLAQGTTGPAATLFVYATNV